MSKKNYFIFKNNKLNYSKLINFVKKNPREEFVIFGFTSNIWMDLLENLNKKKLKIPKNRGILIHGGGWKKLENISISKKKFNKKSKNILGIRNVYNYYGMVEQTGSIFLECEENYFHCSLYSDILIRDENLSIAKKKRSWPFTNFVINSKQLSWSQYFNGGLG